MFFFCEDCRNFFSEDEMKSIRLVDFETGFQRVSKCCPHCRSDYVRRVMKCLRCGEFFFSAEYICPKCVKKLKAELEKFLKKYTVEEQEAMLCE